MNIGAIYNPKLKYNTKCNDGTFSNSKGKYACRTHGGVETYNYQHPVAKTNNGTGIYLIPLNQIATNVEIFQERDEPYALKTVKQIIRNVENKTFSWESFVPIQLWQDDMGNLWILSGHSRTEGFTRLAKKGVVYQGRTFDAIPAQIIKGISIEEARSIAYRSNTSTKPKDTERARLYRKMRNTGTDEKQLKEEIKFEEGDNYSFIYSLTFLNPKGQTLSAYKSLETSGDVTSQSRIKAIANWIGSARMQHPTLSNLHENEMYKWLMSGVYSTKKSSGKITNKREFLDRIYQAIQRNSGMFDKLNPNKPLNLKQATQLAPAEQEYRRMLESAKNELKKAEKELSKANEDFIRRGANQTELKRVIKPYQNTVMAARRRLKQVINQRETARTGAKNQAQLFGIGNITWDSTPDWDEWGWDTYWYCDDWILYHEALLEHYGDLNTANKIWRNQWAKQSSFFSDTKFDCPIQKTFSQYFKDQGIDVGHWGSALITPVLETGVNLSENANETITDLSNTGKNLTKALPYIAIGAGALYAYANRKKIKKALKL